MNARSYVSIVATLSFYIIPKSFYVALSVVDLRSIGNVCPTSFAVKASEFDFMGTSESHF